METEFGSKIFIIMAILLTMTAILTRQPFFIILDIVFIAILIFANKGNLPGFTLRNDVPLKIVVEDGYYKIDKKVKAVLIINDVQYDYRDLSDESLRLKIVQFNKALDTLGEVQYIIKKQKINKSEYMSKLFQKAQNLRIALANDPSNYRARNELEMVQAMIDKINQDEVPFRFIIYFIVETDSVKNVEFVLNTLKKNLESVGLKPRPAKKKEIVALLTDNIRAIGKKPVFPTSLPYMTAFSLPKAPNYQFFEDGIYMGKELGTNRAIFWNYKKMLNQHTLLVGPTGAGKTEALIALAYKVSMFSGIPIIFFDTKSDIKLRLKKYNTHPRVINPLIYGLGLLSPDGASIDAYITQVESILEYSYQLDRYTASVLYKALKSAFNKKHPEQALRHRQYERTMWDNTAPESENEEPTWDDVISEIENMDLRTEIKSLLLRILAQLKEYDFDKKYSIIDQIKDASIYVIDLSMIKSEEVKRLIMLSTLTKIYNKYNIADDTLKVGLVVDEAWTVLKDSDQYSIIADIIKRGRGYGLMLLMATQNIEDLGKYKDVYLENIGLIAFMNNGDKKFWQEVLRFVNVNDDEIRQELTFLGRGEALLRFITDPRPIIIKLDTLINENKQ